MRQQLHESIWIDLTLRGDLQNDLAAGYFNPHDSETPRSDLQSDDFEQVLRFAGQPSETIEQFVANQRNLVLVSCARESLIEDESMAHVRDVVFGQPSDDR